MIPQPFVGDLRRADIILCLLNPGLDAGNWLDEAVGTEARALKLAGLRQEHIRAPFWCIDPEIASTGAYRWWRPKFDALADGLMDDGWTYEEAMEGLSRRVACLEIVPYHSKAAGLITDDLIAALPSSRLAVEFAKERAAEGAQVILFRNHVGWGLPDDGKHVRRVTDSQRSINVGVETLAGGIVRRRMNPDLMALAPFAETFSREGFVFGEWAGGNRLDNGAIQIPYVVASDEGRAFVQAAYDGGWELHGFSWPDWAGGEEAARLRDEPGTVEAASVRQLGKLVTTLIRQERFCEGSISSAVESELLPRILRRIAELVGYGTTPPLELPDPWFTLTIYDGASLDLPGLYEWRIDGVGSYIGRYTRGTRPTKQYAQNVRNLLAGRGYRPGKVAGFRRIHVALADAVRAGQAIELHIIENPAAGEIAARERELIAERGTLNGTGRPGGADD